MGVGVAVIPVSARVAIRPYEQFLRKTAGQVPFAMSRAINATALEFQARERNLIEGNFTVRRRGFIRRQVKIPRGGFARKDRLRAEVEIDPRFDLLQKFEEGGTKKPKESASLAVPVDDPEGGLKGGLRSSVTQVIPKSRRPRAFDLKLHRTKSGKVQFKGEKRTFLVERATFDYGILQRVGRRGGSTTRTLYWSRRSVPIPPTLHFHRTAVRTHRDVFRRHFLKEWIAAIRTAR